MEVASKEEAINLNLLISTAMCLDEQLANVKNHPVHKHLYKKYFNKLDAASKKYMKEIEKVIEDDGAIKALYDEQMEVIYKIRELADEN